MGRDCVIVGLPSFTGFFFRDGGRFARASNGSSFVLFFVLFFSYFAVVRRPKGSFWNLARVDLTLLGFYICFCFFFVSNELVIVGLPSFTEFRNRWFTESYTAFFFCFVFYSVCSRLPSALIRRKKNSQKEKENKKKDTDAAERSCAVGRSPFHRLLPSFVFKVFFLNDFSCYGSLFNSWNGFDQML